MGDSVLKRKDLLEIIPDDIIKVCYIIQKKGFQSYIVGGAIRDIFVGFEPNDYDIATDAKPDTIEDIFHKTIPIGKKHGTITILTDNRIEIEVTTYKGESSSRDIITDLSLRDFTINALAYDPVKDRLIDPLDGLEDLKQKKVRSVGLAKDRFIEDQLRMLRAIRIAVQKEFEIEENLLVEIKRGHKDINLCAIERIKDELSKLLLSNQPVRGIMLLKETGLLKEILPQLVECDGVEQRQDYHKYDVFDHQVYTLNFAPSELVLRLALLFHDIGKPEVKSIGDDGVIHFYRFELVSADKTRQILRKMKFSKRIVRDVTSLIRLHMYSVETDRALRRLILKLGSKEQAIRFARLRYADSMSCRGNKEVISQNYQSLLERIDNFFEEKNALKVNDLPINGRDVMEELDLEPGPAIGWILNKLLEKVVDTPSLNERNKLLGLLPELKERFEHKE